jgi:hypothetical protein
MPDVEPDRFDDVAFRIVESPLPPRRPPRGRRWLLGVSAALVTTGALAGGASALGGGEEPAPPQKPGTGAGSTERRAPFARPKLDCEAGKGRRHGGRERRSTEVQY